MFVDSKCPNQALARYRELQPGNTLCSWVHRNLSCSGVEYFVSHLGSQTQIQKLL